MKILVLNGPNLNLLGLREPSLYGTETYDDLCRKIRDGAEKLGAEVTIRQSNHEGVLVDEIQNARGAFDGIVLNAGGYTHTSVALLDALLAVKVPSVEVHITDPDAREDFRRVNFLRAACVATVKGHGTDGYVEALALLIEKYGN